MRGEGRGSVWERIVTGSGRAQPRTHTRSKAGGRQPPTPAPPLPPRTYVCPKTWAAGRRRRMRLSSQSLPAALASSG